MAVMALEPDVEKVFHEDSYGYRPGRSPQDAVAACRKRCWEKSWVVDMDVKAFFDSVSWDLALRAVACHTDQKWVLLYVERWLKAPMLMPDGTLTERTRGTPQGGPISPLLANLFLHYGFDRWLSLEYPGCRFERFADDAVIHCVTERQAVEVRDAVGRRFASIGLTLHPDKTKIVFCQDGKRRRDFPVTSFTFCGYEFRPRRAFNKATREAFTNFLPAAAPGKITEVGRKVASWKLHRRTDLTLDAIAKEVNPVVGGWLAYFTAFCPMSRLAASAPGSTGPPLITPCAWSTWPGGSPTGSPPRTTRPGSPPSSPGCAGTRSPRSPSSAATALSSMPCSPRA